MATRSIAAEAAGELPAGLVDWLKCQCSEDGDHGEHLNVLDETLE